MNGIWNCDFQNMSHGGCSKIGGAAIDFNLEWCRFQYEGDAWSSAPPEPWVSFGAPGTRENYANNIVFKTQKNMDSYAFYRNPNQHNPSAVPDVTFRNNTLYNFALAYRNNNSEGVTDVDNTWIDNDLNVPARPTIIR